MIDMSVSWHRNFWRSTCVGRNCLTPCIFCKCHFLATQFPSRFTLFLPIPDCLRCKLSQTSMSAGKKADVNCPQGEAALCCVSRSDCSSLLPPVSILQLLWFIVVGLLNSLAGKDRLCLWYHLTVCVSEWVKNVCVCSMCFQCVSFFFYISDKKYCHFFKNVWYWFLKFFFFKNSV